MSKLKNDPKEIITYLSEDPVLLDKMLTHWVKWMPLEESNRILTEAYLKAMNEKEYHASYPEQWINKANLEIDFADWKENHR